MVYCAKACQDIKPYRPNVETMGFYFYFSNSTEIAKTYQAVWAVAYTNFWSSRSNIRLQYQIKM